MRIPERTQRVLMIAVFVGLIGCTGCKREASHSDSGTSSKSPNLTHTGVHQAFTIPAANPAQGSAPSLPSTDPSLARFITCEIAYQISDRWDRIVDDVSSCFFDRSGTQRGPRGKLDSGLAVCTQGEKSVQLVPALDPVKPVLFGDDFTRSQTVIARANGRECFTLTRKANPGTDSLVRLSRGSEVLFETSRDSAKFLVHVDSQDFYLPLDLKTQIEFTKCRTNISGNWGSDHVFYGPQSIFQSFTFHLAKSNRVRFDSLCER